MVLSMLVQKAMLTRTKWVMNLVMVKIKELRLKIIENEEYLNESIEALLIYLKKEMIYPDDIHECKWTTDQAKMPKNHHREIFLRRKR